MQQFCTTLSPLPGKSPPQRHPALIISTSVCHRPGFSRGGLDLPRCHMQQAQRPVSQQLQTKDDPTHPAVGLVE